MLTEKNIFNKIKEVNTELKEMRESKDVFLKENKKIKDELLLKSCGKMLEFFDNLIESIEPISFALGYMEWSIDIDMALCDWRRTISKIVVDPTEKCAYIDIHGSYFMLNTIDNTFYSEYIEGDEMVGIDELGVKLSIQNFKNNREISDSDKECINKIVYTFLMNKEMLEKSILRKVSDAKNKMLERYEEELHLEKKMLEDMKEYISE